MSAFLFATLYEILPQKIDTMNLVCITCKSIKR